MVAVPKVAVDNTQAFRLDSGTTGARMGHSIIVKNAGTNTSSVFLGRSNAVTVSGGAVGYELAPGDTFTWDMDDDEALWCRAPVAVTLDVFEGGI